MATKDSKDTKVIAAPEKGDEKLTAANVVDEFLASWKYTSTNHHEQWRKNWKIANNERVSYGYEGIANTFVPLTFSIIQAAKANLIGGRPKQTFLPTNDQQREDTKILDSYMDYDWEKGNWQSIIDPWTEDMLTFGNGVIRAYWHPTLDVSTGEVIGIKDFWIDPTCKSLEQAEQDNKPAGHRYLTTKAILKSRMIVNVDYKDSDEESDGNPRMKPFYDHAAIDKAPELTPENFNEDDAERYVGLYDGSTLSDPEKQQVEVIVRYTNDRWVEVINRSEVILDTENELGMLPYADQSIFRPTRLFYGRGYPEILLERQEDLNDLENQDTDNMSYQLDTMKWVDPQYQDLIDDIQAGPGVVLPIPKDMMGELDRPSYNPKANEKRAQIKEDMREAVGAGEILQAGGSNTDKTATEINAQQLNAGKRFDVQLQALENGGFKRLGILRFKLTQKYADKETFVRVVSNKGVSFKKFKKDLYDGDYEPRITLDSSAKTEQARLGQQLDQMYAELIKNPLINQQELTKFTLQKRWNLDEDEVNMLMGNPGQPGEPEPGDGEGGPEAAMAAAAGGGMPGMAPAPAMPMDAAGALQAPVGTEPVPGAAPPPDPSVPTAADLVKIYVAAAGVGALNTMNQIEQKLGLVPDSTVPVAHAAKAEAMDNARTKLALDIQDKQHKHESAQESAAREAAQAMMPSQGDAGVTQ